MAERKKRPDSGLLVRGSLYTLRRKCGKENCRCRKGYLHETPVLTYKVGGEAKILSLRDEDLPRVREAIERYREAKGALEARALAGIEALRTELAERRRGGG